MLSRILIFFMFVLVLIKSENNPSYSVRIYSNQAEIIYLLDKLPLEFTDDEWNEIRSDSITLLSDNIHITSQTISEKRKSLNGAKIYIRSPISLDKSTLIFVQGILIDEHNYLVKIQDESIAGQQTLFFSVPPDHIFYLEQPPKSKFYVNFTYDTTDSQVHVTYLRSNLKWHTQYQLNLYENNSTLIAMANIRNDGKSPISIDHAELIGGDVNLNTRSRETVAYFTTTTMTTTTATTMAKTTTIEQGTELFGLYVFTINQPFTIDAKTNYLLPMFHPHVTVERYGLISKYFQTTSNTGYAQRSYRLRSDRYLSRGNCIIRESDRIVGETFLPNLGAKDKYHFSIGQDTDIFYKENVSLISSTKLEENHQHETQTIHTSTRKLSIYEINIQIKNFKTRSITIEYEQTFLYSFQNIQLIMLNNHSFIQDGETIKSNMILQNNDDQTFSYRIERTHH
ncbi:unnamed protein product [Adineta steineri]|uniref:DUF4139 domain-containing protein n=1 Tax=Adineta steineri TaxID=433720 RepID=A0A814HTV9_9BILA|nr:unnamed protein product [Adineta steineri]CAF1199764.1 unnamed protein product [Adineta steineri]